MCTQSQHLPIWGCLWPFKLSIGDRSPKLLENSHVLTRFLFFGTFKGDMMEMFIKSQRTKINDQFFKVPIWYLVPSVTSISPCLSLCLSVSFTLFLSLFLSVCLSVCPSVYLSFCGSVNPAEATSFGSLISSRTQCEAASLYTLIWSYIFCARALSLSL